MKLIATRTPASRCLSSLCMFLGIKNVCEPSDLFTKEIEKILESTKDEMGDANGFFIDKFKVIES